MAQDYTELGYDANLTKPTTTPGGSNAMSSIEADSQFGDGTFPGMKLSSGPNIMAFGFADNFDSSYPFYLPYYIDSSQRVVRATLSLFFSPFRGYSTTTAAESAHTHNVTIGDHTHTVSVAAHSHSLTGIATEDEGTGGTAHQHTVLVQKDSWDDSTPNADRVPLFVDSQGVPGPHGACTSGDLGQLKGNHYGRNTPPNDNDISFKTNCTIDGHNHSVTGGTASSAGSQTPTSSSGGGTTVASAAGSSHVHGAAYAIYSGAYPTSVSIEIDDVDVTTALGGPWNPSAGDPNELDMDITQYTANTGAHKIELITTGQGRCIPMLIIKSVIGSKS